MMLGQSPAINIPACAAMMVEPGSCERCSSDDGGEEVDLPLDAYSCDEFRMYEFKVRKCVRGRSHDWTDCPYAHPGEKARRRDPRKFHYSGAACPDFRKGSCTRGDFCEFAHGVFECWLHPARYRTQACKDGMNCRRRVCFFAHTPEQLRVLPHTHQQFSPPPDSPPLSSMNEMLASMQRMQLSVPACCGSPPLDSPPLSSMNEMLASMQRIQLSVPACCGSPRSPSFYSYPATPTGHFCSGNGSGRISDGWAESGRSLRTKLYEKLTQGNFLGKKTSDEEEEGAAVAGPDVDWITEMLK